VSPVSTSTVKATFINHSTVLIEHDGIHIITDPIFTKRASPVTFAGPRRFHDPYMQLKEIPSLDLVLISHNHYDHLSLDTIKLIEKAHKPLYIVPLNNAQFLKRVKVPDERIVELATFDQWSFAPDKSKVQHESVLITLDKAQHWSTRSSFDRNRYLWGSYIIEIGGKKIFFAGDTGYNSHFKEIKQRYGVIDLALLPIGAYEPRWFMREQHMNPYDAVIAAKDMEIQNAMGIHFGTFMLTDEGRSDPEKDLKEAVEKENFKGEFLVPNPTNGLVVEL
jgi:L-ascorbate metabolism protein UlaG (beta-lactamase superfamily)